MKKKYIEESALLKNKYLDEYTERKRLYNEVIELKGNIRVFCRCRPLNQQELANGSNSIVEIAPSQDHELSIACADSSKKQFKFDHVFGPHAEQGNLITLILVYLVGLHVFGVSLKIDFWIRRGDFCTNIPNCHLCFGWLQCLHFRLWTNWNRKDFYHGRDT